MAKINPKGRMEERNRHRGGDGGGGGQYPTFTKEEGKFPYACLSIAHSRAKGTGRWCIAFLLLCVSGPQKGTILIQKCWTEDQLHDMIAGGFGFNEPYEGALPGGNQNWDDFNADSGDLDEMSVITTCKDQRVTAKGPDAGKWLPGIAASARRAPYVLVTVAKGNSEKGYMEGKYIDPVRERGTEGPFWIQDWRDTLMDMEHRKLCVDYFATKCQKEVREANEAAQKRRQSGGDGGGDHGGGDGQEFDDTEIPF